MKTTPKFIVLHPSVHKPAGGGGGGGHRAWLAVFMLFFIFSYGFTLFTAKDSATDSADADAASRLPQPIFDALLHYATDNATASPASVARMSPAEMKAIATTIRRCAAPCNVLVFGLTHETFLWNALNHHNGGGGGRTVFVGDNSYQISKIEEKHPWIEAYDIQFTTKVGELTELIDHARREVGGECRPVQNLLFSDCRLAINDLPNYVYDVAWDVIVVDGPLGNTAAAPGRAAAIFTAGVLARSKSGARGTTHVFVHDIGREVEKLCSQEFLCTENMVEKKDSLAHFLVGKTQEISINTRKNNFGKGTNKLGFCSNSFHHPPSPKSS